MASKIIFKEDSHQYFNSETGDEYTSVSHVIGNFKEKFDAENISKFVAKKRGITQEEVLKEWDAIRDHACTRGTGFHLVMENYIKFGEVPTEYKKVIQDFAKCTDKCISDVKNIMSEVLFYNDEFKVAGTSDICWEHNDGTFTIGDFKTNKKFRFVSDYNNWLKAPLSHLMECEFNTYTLQLSLYAFMYEILTGKKCRGLLILWLNPARGIWEPIRCNYLKHEVIMMLKTFKKIKENSKTS